jgi:hypothetical protein
MNVDEKASVSFDICIVVGATARCGLLCRLPHGLDNASASAVHQVWAALTACKRHASLSVLQRTGDTHHA